jgi:FKBP-type peptidyl-prolyl cis-trans isomerase
LENKIMNKMDKKTIIAIVIAVVLVGALVGGGLLTGIFNKTDNSKETMTQSGAQLQSKDLVTGTGDVAVAGKQVTVNYTGVFTDGKKFDSSLDRGVPFTFTLGAGQVIKGWDLGVEGMKVGGKRILVVPPELGYGANTYGPIPGNSTLIFQIELLGVK